MVTHRYGGALETTIRRVRTPNKKRIQMYGYVIAFRVEPG